ncbi:helix-turn-helix domain-containing protein [Streptomyces chiangmaiensis]
MSGVQSVARAMAVLEELAQSGATGVNELARKLDLAPSTVQRLLGALSEVGVVEQDPSDRSYRSRCGSSSGVRHRCAGCGCASWPSLTCRNSPPKSARPSLSVSSTAHT